ncbi:MAG: thioesterase [Planctomycetes bacterium RBG_13_63_9]|nr:MAG: thioesterase [Planctomycetes bacterium RBG_13_63_9]
MLKEHETEIRVRYQETDAMGYLHHANYFTYFEVGRTEMLRASGGDYRKMEADGVFIVVAKAECRFRRPARYDDLLKIRTTIVRVTRARIEHEYRVLRDDQELAVAQLTLAAVDRQGRPCRVPEWMHSSED